jgi:CBS domain-containing protein
VPQADLQVDERRSPLLTQSGTCSTKQAALGNFVPVFGRRRREPNPKACRDAAVQPIVTAARTLALKHGVRPTSTVTRLSELKARSLVDADVIDKALSAFTTLVRMVLTQQVADSDCGIGLSARVNATAMNPDEKESLVKAMNAINSLIEATLQL